MYTIKLSNIQFLIPQDLKYKMVWVGYPPPRDEERVACGWLWPLYINLFVKTRVSRLKVICFINVVFNRAPVIRLKANQFFFTSGSRKKKLIGIKALVQTFFLKRYLLTSIIYITCT